QQIQGRCDPRPAQPQQGGRGRPVVARGTDRGRYLWSRSGEPAQAACRDVARAGCCSAPRGGRLGGSLYTHIDDFVENLRVVTPRGVVESRRLPGSGAGPSPDRMFIGSEGILGVISRAWMRLQPRPKFRSGASVRFQTFFEAARAVRSVAQAGLYPSNCRILDAHEAYNTGAADGSVAIMVLGFESGDHPTDAWMARALECCADHGGQREVADAGEAHLKGAAGVWRNAFIR